MSLNPHIQCRLAHRRRAEAARRGTSLLEILAVATIIGILAAIAIPRFANAASHQKAGAAARRVAADLKLTSQLARAKGQSHRLRVPANSHTCIVEVTTDGLTWAAIDDMDRLGSAYRVHLQRPPYEAAIAATSAITIPQGTFTTPIGIVPEGNDALVMYNRDGMPAASGVVALRVGQVRKMVSVEGSTGKITITDGWTDGGPWAVEPLGTESGGVESN